MATSDNFDDTLPLIAPVGGQTVSTMFFDANTRLLALATTAAASGLQFAGKVFGRVADCPVVSTVTITQGQSLAWLTTTNNLSTSATGVNANSHAIAAYSQAAGGTTVDVILTFPRAFLFP